MEQDERKFDEEAEIAKAMAAYRRSRPSLEEARRLHGIYSKKHEEAVVEGTGGGEFHYVQKKALERYIASLEAKREIVDALKAVES